MSCLSRKYHPGDAFPCPQCGLSSEVKETFSGDSLFGPEERKLTCAFCGWELPADWIAPTAKTSAAPGKSQDSALLDDLFGNGDSPDDGLSLQDEEARFCKNCAHFLATPFACRCHKFQTEVEPMHFCKEFLKK
ncbi:MAG: hypothetical protein MJ202_08045 [Lentisphaeria bacterium]|nr:hypothetical protein [Lentisphaeria bacterium]